MKTKAAKRAIRKIAKREGITECEVRKEMEKAIMIGFMNTGTRQKWNEITQSGGIYNKSIRNDGKIKTITSDGNEFYLFGLYSNKSAMVQSKVLQIRMSTSTSSRVIVLFKYPFN